MSQDALVSTFDHPIKLPIFEGPLDLLLFLIRRNEIDVYDIPIETVTKQYLEVLYAMEKLSLEVAGEFFVMAANLMHIKSRMLLPKNDQAVEDESEEEDVDPRWELVQQLLEYKKFKEAAGSIEDLIEEASQMLPRLYKDRREDRPERPLKPTDRIEMWNVFNSVLRRLSEKITVGEIHDETVTVADRMEFILETLTRRPSFRFSELFKGEAYSLVTIVSTFLAVLELTRLKKLRIAQTEAFGDIDCQSHDGTEEPVEAGAEALPEDDQEEAPDSFVDADKAERSDEDEPAPFEQPLAMAGESDQATAADAAIEAASAALGPRHTDAPESADRKDLE